MFRQITRLAGQRAVLRHSPLVRVDTRLFAKKASCFTYVLQAQQQPYSHDDLRAMLMEQTEKPLMGESLGGDNPPLSKIVATIGPASEDFETLDQCVGAGMDVMRLNFSHATYEEAKMRMDRLDQSRANHNSVLATLLDTRGPEVRLGKLEGDVAVAVATGDRVTLTNDPQFAESSRLDRMFCTLPSVARSVEPGRTLLIDDGLIALQVDRVEMGSPDGDLIHCTATNNGTLGSRKSLALPGCQLEGLPALTPKDEQDLAWGIKHGVDFVAISFVRSVDDITTVRQFVDRCYDEVRDPQQDRLPPKLIAKIECVEALRHFPEILAASDGIMVARGDLGVEIPLSSVAVVQKQMVAAARDAGKLAIVATQMLESMQKNPRPTRSEVSDVTNAIEDGCDAVMLSGESANGQYPVEAVRTMDEVARVADALQVLNAFSLDHGANQPDSEDRRRLAAAAEAVALMATRVSDVQRVVTTDDTGGDLARYLSRLHFNVPVVPVVSSERLARQLVLHRSLFPVIAPSNGSIEDAVITQARKHTPAVTVVKNGDEFKIALVP